MAILRGRQVQLVSKHEDSGIAPTYTVCYPDGETEYVRISELELTQEEHDKVLSEWTETLGLKPPVRMISAPEITLPSMFMEPEESNKKRRK